MQSKDDQLRKYRQRLSALLECTTKLAAGRAALVAAEEDMRAREAELAVLNEEVVAFMSKARCALRCAALVGGCGGVVMRQHEVELAVLNEEVVAFMSKARCALRCTALCYGWAVAGLGVVSVCVV